MKTLDTTKPYGQVYGAHERGAAFEQNGVLFDAAGKALSAEPAGETAPDKAALKDSAAPKLPITLPTGTVDLDGQDKEALHALAAANGLTLHAQLGLKRTIEELQKSFPYVAAAAPAAGGVDDQLNQQ